MINFLVKMKGRVITEPINRIDFNADDMFVHEFDEHSYEFTCPMCGSHDCEPVGDPHGHIECDDCGYIFEDNG